MIQHRDRTGVRKHSTRSEMGSLSRQDQVQASFHRVRQACNLLTVRSGRVYQSPTQKVTKSCTCGSNEKMKTLAQTSSSVLVIHKETTSLSPPGVRTRPNLSHRSRHVGLGKRAFHTVTRTTANKCSFHVPCCGSHRMTTTIPTCSSLRFRYSAWADYPRLNFP